MNELQLGPEPTGFTQNTDLLADLELSLNLSVKVKESEAGKSRVVLDFHQQGSPRLKLNSSREHANLTLDGRTGYHAAERPYTRLIFVSDRKMQYEIDRATQAESVEALGPVFPHQVKYEMTR
jgi:hypothetical protein